MKFVILKLSAAAFAMLATASGVYATEEEPSNSYPSKSLRGSFLHEDEESWPFAGGEESWPFAGGNDLSTCTSSCHCPMGGCVMNQCQTNCQCAMGGCQMNGCRDNCQCAMGSCQMTSCTQNCQCAMGNCQRDEDEGLDEAVAFTEA